MVQVVRFNGDEWDLCFDTPVTQNTSSGVITFLTKDEVGGILEEIKALEA